YLTAADFHQAGVVTGTLFDGTAVSAPYYALNAGVPVPAGTGEGNRPNWSSNYDGVELTWQKRLSNKWMMRGNFAWSNWKQNSNGTNGCVDPTNQLNVTFGTGCPVNRSDLMVAPSGT